MTDAGRQQIEEADSHQLAHPGEGCLERVELEGPAEVQGAVAARAETCCQVGCRVVVWQSVLAHEIGHCGAVSASLRCPNGLCLHVHEKPKSVDELYVVILFSTYSFLAILLYVFNPSFMSVSLTYNPPPFILKRCRIETESTVGRVLGPTGRAPQSDYLDYPRKQKLLVLSFCQRKKLPSQKQVDRNLIYPDIVLSSPKGKCVLKKHNFVDIMKLSSFS